MGIGTAIIGGLAALGAAGVVGAICDSGEKSSRNVGREESYDPRAAKAEQTMRINRSLDDLRQKMRENSRKVEDASLEATRETIDNLMSELQKINDTNYVGRKLNLNIERLKRENKKAEEVVHGCFAKYVGKRISLDDSECCEILEMEAGSDKERRMANFVKKVTKESLEEIQKQIKNSLMEQMENISAQVNDRLQTISFSAEEKVREYEEISKNKDEDEGKLEKTLLSAGSLASLCAMGIHLSEQKASA